jgi:uncharacterized protein YcbK (DUF882 family)
MAQDPGRRTFVRLALLAALASRSSRGEGDDGSERRLALYNTHTSESVDVVYWADGHFLEGGRRAIDNVLRDHRTGEVARIDHDLLDLLFALRRSLATTAPFHVISGYRSQASNEYLRGLGPNTGVAKKSLHIKAKAADIRVPGQDLGRVHEAAMDLRLGGVGYYPDSDFVHVDVGPVRHW